MLQAERSPRSLFSAVCLEARCCRVPGSSFYEPRLRADKHLPLASVAQDLVLQRQVLTD